MIWAANQRDKTQFHPPVGRHQKQEELQTCSLRNGDNKHRKLDKMRQQRNIFQMKGQDKIPQEQINEEKIGKLHEREFRVRIVKMIQDLSKRMEAQEWRSYKRYLTKS